MATVAEIEALLKARDLLSAKLKEIQRTAGTETGKISGHFDKMAERTKRVGDKMSSIGKGMAVGVTLPIIAAAGLAVKSLGRIETIGAQTDAAIKSTGGAANVSRQQIDDLAGSLESLTSVEAETITEGQNLLLTFTKISNQAGKGNDIFDRATKAALDMSVAMGSDMTSASIMVGKALNDPVKGLTAMSKAGIQFTQAQKDQIVAMVEAGDTMGAQKVILGELTTQFGGSAEALGNTMVGKIEKAKHAFGTMTETLATALIPTIEKVTGWIQKAADWFNNLSPAGQNVVGIMIAVVAAVGPVLFVFGKLISSFGAVGKAFMVLSKLFMANPWILLIAAVIALVILIVANWDKIVGFLKGVWEWIKTTSAAVGKWLKDKFKEAVDFLVGLFLNFTPLGLIIKHFDKIKAVATGVKDWIVASFNFVVDFFKGLPGRIGNAVSGMWDGIKTAFKTVLNWIIDKWNNLSITLPKIDLPGLPAFGGQTINFPNIPRLHKGGVFRAPTPGGEGLAVLRDRETVTPARGTEGPIIGTVVVQGNTDPLQVGDYLAWRLRTAGI